MRNSSIYLFILYIIGVFVPLTYATSTLAEDSNLPNLYLTILRFPFQYVSLYCQLWPSVVSFFSLSHPPTNLQAAHDKLVKKIDEQAERERRAEDMERAAKSEAKFKAMKGKFFGLLFTDGLINVRVLESVEEHRQEGSHMHHCVFSASYYLNEESLILSATINGERVETVEFSLDEFRVVQSRGVCNKNTEYHDRIVSLVNSNADIIRQRMKAA